MVEFRLFNGCGSQTCRIVTKVSEVHYSDAVGARTSIRLRNDNLTQNEKRLPVHMDHNVHIVPDLRYRILGLPSLTLDPRHFSSPNDTLQNDLKPSDQARKVSRHWLPNIRVKQTLKQNSNKLPMRLS
jgi:hypothetical protein